ncbi:MAG TPA: 30S ribosomal protein S16 [Alphaproteobacteria bacterium]|nr:30S ribosomal protein S16 [Alphaproteobacteria bacterium]
MATKIRMSRAGAKNRPFFRIVVADSRSPRDGRFLEKLGTYNPLLQKDDPHRVVLNVERIKHWLSVGATPSDRVARFLHEANLGPKPVIRETPKKSAPRAKTQERLKAAAGAAGGEAAPAAAAEPAKEATA